MKTHSFKGFLDSVVACEFRSHASHVEVRKFASHQSQ